MIYHMANAGDSYRHTDASDAKDKRDDTVRTQICFARQLEVAGPGLQSRDGDGRVRRA